MYQQEFDARLFERISPKFLLSLTSSKRKRAKEAGLSINRVICLRSSTAVMRT
jgi:hypothetical protein